MGGRLRLRLGGAGRPGEQQDVTEHGPVSCSAAGGSARAPVVSLRVVSLRVVSLQPEFAEFLVQVGPRVVRGDGQRPGPAAGAYALACACVCRALRLRPVLGPAGSEYPARGLADAETAEWG